MEEKKLVRCFIALELNREAITEIEEIQKLIKNKKLFYGKLTEPENLHLTLKFLGEIKEDRVESVKKELGKIKFNSFQVGLGELGVFNDRILWIKLNGKEIWDLQKQIDDLLESLGFAKEERFMSHITLARMKKVIDRKVMVEYIKNLRHREICFDVKEFILKKSELKIEGPVYSDIEKYNLK
jgi:2'-5' RNA ligase